VWILALVAVALWIAVATLRKGKNARGPSPRRAEPTPDARRHIPTPRARASAPSPAAPARARDPAALAGPAITPREGTRRPSNRTDSHAGGSAYARRSARPDRQ
jgi:hypothetical protein